MHQRKKLSEKTMKHTMVNFILGSSSSFDLEAEDGKDEVGETGHDGVVRTPSPALSPAELGGDPFKDFATSSSVAGRVSGNGT